MLYGWPGVVPEVRVTPQNSIFAGMDSVQLQAALTAAQNALVQLQSGMRVVSVSYAQGDGSKSVTYQRADMSSLTQLIRQMQLQLGIPTMRRRGLRPVF